MSKSNAYRKYANYLTALLLFSVSIWILSALRPLQMPDEYTPACLYATQVGDDLKQLYLQATDEAGSSILLMIYALVDAQLIQKLKEKSEQGVNVHVVCDPTASPRIARKLGPKVRLIRRHGKGLMHHKILVVDRLKVWGGSANWTGESLRFHGNLVIGVASEPLAAEMERYAELLSTPRNKFELHPKNYIIGEQSVEVWLMPNPRVVKRLLDIIQQAEKTVRVAMFTWTHLDLAQAVVEANQRGVDTAVVIDRYAGKGAGAKVVNFLKEKGVSVRLSQGNALLHHKFLYVDGKTVVNGSANWTKAAFSKNDDCLFILHHLTMHQKQKIDLLWQSIFRNSCEESNDEMAL